MFKQILPFCALALFACGAATEDVGPLPEPDGESIAEELHKDVSTYYVVTRQDFRKCMYPMCGGYFVKRVNRIFTRCADGVWRGECHAVNVDLSALGLSEQAASDFTSGTFGAGYGLVRGELELVDGAQSLVASEAWVGQSRSEAYGGVWRVNSSGIVCITSPCPSYNEALLNHGYNRNIHGVDLAESGADPKAVEAGHQELADAGILVAGLHWKTWGMSGSGIELRASEFYTRLTGTSYCATTYINAPNANSPTFYVKNFSSEKDAWAWLGQNFPHGDDRQVIQGPCNQPRACIQVYKPVCGVIKDSPENTYSNSCAFESALMADAGSDGESKGFYNPGECKAACDYQDPSRKYVATSPAQCQLVKFFCDSGTPFFDECGCGCLLPSR
jgi:hypothetical protein